MSLFISGTHLRVIQKVYVAVLKIEIDFSYLLATERSQMTNNRENREIGGPKMKEKSKISKSLHKRSYKILYN